MAADACLAADASAASRTCWRQTLSRHERSLSERVELLNMEKSLPGPIILSPCAFAAQSGGGWWLAGSGARCLLGALMRTFVMRRRRFCAGARIRVPGFITPS